MIIPLAQIVAGETIHIGVTALFASVVGVVGWLLKGSIERSIKGIDDSLKTLLAEQKGTDVAIGALRERVLKLETKAEAEAAATHTWREDMRRAIDELRDMIRDLTEQYEDRARARHDENNRLSGILIKLQTQIQMLTGSTPPPSD